MYKLAITTRKNNNTSNYIVRETYIDWLSHDFSISLITPRPHHDYQDIAEMYDLLLICGGDDIEPGLFNEPLHPTTVLEDRQVESMDFALLHDFVERGKPVIGICRGIQIINVYFHGTLIQDIPSMVENTLQHKVSTHPIVCEPCVLNNYFPLKFDVNSYHHQSVGMCASDLDIYAISPDGIIESIGYDLILGVQWHPERMDDTHKTQLIKLMKDFVILSKTRKQ